MHALAQPSYASDRHPSDRPRERLYARGREHVSDVELIALVLGTGIHGRSALELARDLLAETGSLAAIARASPSDLAQVRGIGLANAARLTAAFTLGMRASAGRHLPIDIGSPADVQERMWPRLAGLTDEVFVALGVDADNRVVGEFEVARGSRTTVRVEPRDVFRPLVRIGASGAVVVHNHPSGDPAPSDADLDITARLRQAGELIGLPLVDHVIVSARGFVSLAEWTMGLHGPATG